MEGISLGGHSGCKILLCETEDNKSFVRKISSDHGYNHRLKLQAEKQANYKNKVLRSPLVYHTGYTEDGLFYFDMEYIRGITLAEYMKTIEIGKIRALVETIVENIVDTKTAGTDVDETVFLTKIETLSCRLQKQDNPVIITALDLLAKHSWKKFSRTACHGDLTLENIIVKDNQLYLIDFLDSFYDCWIMDMSTLMQDVQTMWSYRLQNNVNINTLLRLIVFRDILLDEMQKYAHEDFAEVYYALLLKLVRIYPYTKDEQTYNFLNKKTMSIIQIIKELVL